VVIRGSTAYDLPQLTERERVPRFRFAKRAEKLDVAVNLGKLDIKDTGRMYRSVELVMPQQALLVAEVRVGTGNVLIENIGPLLTVIAGRANIEVTDCFGKIAIGTGSGNCTIKGFEEGSVGVKSGGSVDIDGMRGSVNVHAKGNITMRRAKLEAASQLTSDGDIGVSVRNDALGIVIFTSQRVIDFPRIENDFTISYDSNYPLKKPVIPIEGPRIVEGYFGDSEPSITLQLTSNKGKIVFSREA